MDEPESKGGSRKAGAPGRFVEADLESYQKITLPRRRLGRWCNEPFFEEAVHDCYVKLFIGINEEGKRCYRLCRIINVMTEKVKYNLPQVKNEKPVSLRCSDSYLCHSTRFPLHLSLLLGRSLRFLRIKSSICRSAQQIENSQSNLFLMAKLQQRMSISMLLH
jgi:hypothetical protein